MKIIIICAAGMSSSLIVEKMKAIAPEGTSVEYSVGMDAIRDLSGYDVLLVGPQLRYKKDKIKEAADKANIPYGFIDMVQYGRVMAKEIYEQAVALYEGKNK